MPTWPETLPQQIVADRYTEGEELNTVASSIDDTNRNMRRRAAADPFFFRGQLVLTANQVEIFNDFYMNTLHEGVYRFEWIHPRTKASRYVRFQGPPALEPYGGVNWILNIDMEVFSYGP